MARMKEVHGKRWFRFVPEGFVLPADTAMFLASFKANLGQAWIVKPSALSCGRGIFVTNDLDEIRALDMSETTWAVQQYVANPLLLHDTKSSGGGTNGTEQSGYKFDLRIYVTVTSFNPLRIYMHEDGLTRFATAPYSSSPEHYNNRFMHLTNYSVNKHNEAFEFNDNSDNDDVGTKWSLKALRRKLEAMGVDHHTLWKRIHHVIIMTFLSCEHQVNAAIDMHVPYKNKNCFQLFGFDILVDEHLEPVLIEINFSPSLACGTPLDLKIKSTVIADTLSIACVQPYDDVKMKGRIKPKKKKGKKKNAKGTKGTKGTKPKSYGGSPTNYGVDAHTLASLTPEERRAIAEFEAENRVSNGYTCIFPSVDGFMYRQFFDEIRPLNELMSQYMVSKAAKQKEEEEMYHMEQRAKEGRDEEESDDASVSGGSVSSSNGGQRSDRTKYSSRRKKLHSSERRRKGGGKKKTSSGTGAGHKKTRSSALTQAALSHANRVSSRSLGGLEEPVLQKGKRRKKLIRTASGEGEAFRYLF